MFANLRIGSRLTLGFGVVLALLCLMAGISAWQSNKLAGNAEYYAVNLVPSFKSIHDITMDLDSIRRWEYRHIVNNDLKSKDETEAKILEFQKSIQAKLDHYARDFISNEDDRRALENLRAAIKSYSAIWENLRPLSRAGAQDPAKHAEAVQVISGPSLVAFQKAAEAAEQWWHINSGLADEQQTNASNTYTNAKLTLGLMVVAALGLGIAAAIVITRSITTPIAHAVHLAETVAEGDLTSHIDIQGKDETAQLLQALKHMNERLVQVVSRVRQSSDSIATGSTQIAAGTVDLSQRTEEQASNLEETAASMEELTSTVKTNSETANQASKLASSAAHAATNGGTVVQQVIETMDGISQSSKKIADIIGVIDGIAFQTNILALNAAVEAARAGEQGRGFAVVASEVRALAQRSAGAAKEIKLLINDSVEKVDEGSRQVNEAGRSMGEIVDQVQRVSRLIEEISSATSEQSSGINQVGDAVNQLDQVTQQNAALVEQSAAAADSLKHQASQLLEAVSIFKLAASMQTTATTATKHPAKPISHKSHASSALVHKGSHQRAGQAPAAAPAASAAPQARPARQTVPDDGGEWETF